MADRKFSPGAGWQSADGRNRRRSLRLRTASVLRSEGRHDGLRQACYRNLSEMGAEAIEPVLNADGGDRKIANGRIINPFDPGVPRRDPRRRERQFAPHPLGNQ
ncbi:MAG: hypothetical protein MOB07_29755 [Acidobacteria bacterium]|nr:hypothetical protein [Acidobacteriota bacterium]